MSVIKGTYIKTADHITRTRKPGIQLFRGRLSEKRCTGKSGKVIWAMMNTLFLTTVVVKLTFVAFL